MDKTLPRAPTALQKWRMKNARTVGDYGVFSVRRSGLTDASGLPRRDVHTLHCRDWCNVIPVTADGKVVLVWQYRFGTDEFSLEAPGGVIDDGEAPERAAARELKEEAGATSDELELLNVLEPNPAFQGNRLHSFVAWNTVIGQGTAFDDLEELETCVVRVADLPDLLDLGVVRHALCTTALETFLRRHGSKFMESRP